jgi:hypothetical protein
MVYTASTLTGTNIFLLDLVHCFIKIKLCYKNHCCQEEWPLFAVGPMRNTLMDTVWAERKNDLCSTRWQKVTIGVSMANQTINTNHTYRRRRRHHRHNKLGAS